MASPYSDLDRPPLSARALTRALFAPGEFWSRLDIRAVTGSTNADAIAAAHRGEPEGLVVVAEQQSAGRGRRDRQWTSPPRAGLTLSVLLRPGRPDAAKDWAPAPAAAFSWLPLLAGVALREAVQRVAEVDATLKWPNDLLIKDAQRHEGKGAGILAEMAGDAVVVGIGLNVSTRADELPETTGLPATSLRVAGASQVDREPLLRALLRGIADWYQGWREADGDAELCGLLAAYRRGCSTIGQDVHVLLPGGGELIGRAIAVDPDGQLVVRTADGGDHHVSAGDVLHVR
ncbi:MAG TPA: biotin--[acetyl-CoA-carboxylase] ligase [Actinoplanes sp.]|jgi:BirA family biotin operon repressor/biotin-[acetyl-CoA-carboxylase] ligase